MGFDNTLLRDINPFPTHEADRWSEGSAGQRTLLRVLDQTSDGVAAFDQEPGRRRWPWLVAVAAAAVVAALSIPTAILMRSTGTVTTGSLSVTRVDGAWMLDSFIVDGEFTAVEVGVNSATLPTIEIGSRTVGNTGCNDFTVYGAGFTPDGFTVDGTPVVLGEVVRSAALCDVEDGTGLMFTPSVFREAMGNPTGFRVSSVDGTMQWLVDGSYTLLFFVRVDRGIELTPDETMQVRTWVNMLGLAQFHPVVWRDRFDRMCSEGVWNPDVALALSSEFIATDLDAGASVRDASIGGPPSPQDGAFALWSMAVNTCRDRFPEGAIEQGPPSFDGVGASGSS